METRLAEISGIEDAKVRVEQYRALCASAVDAQSEADCCALLVHLVGDDVPLVIARQLLSFFATDISRLPSSVQKSVALFALERIQPRVVSFEEHATTLREALAAVHENEENWSQAAKVCARVRRDETSHLSI